MVKKIIREIIIMLLLCLAIILLLGVVLYNYTPGNKTMPDKVSYVIPSEVKKELEQASLSENEQIILTYEITSEDLRNSRYESGKPNPFSSYKTETEENTDENNTGNSGTNTKNNTTTTQGNSTTTQSGSTTDTTDTDGSPYTHDKGTK